MREAQTSADQAALADANATKKLEAGMRRRRPLEQYVILRKPSDVYGTGEFFQVERSAAGSKPSHWLIHPPYSVGAGPTLEDARRYVPAGFKRLPRRKDDRVDVVEVWV